MLSLYFYCTSSLLHTITITKDQNKSVCTKNISLQSFEVGQYTEEEEEEDIWHALLYFLLYFFISLSQTCFTFCKSQVLTMSSAASLHHSRMKAAGRQNTLIRHLFSQMCAGQYF